MGQKLVIVESPTKAKTIGKYLGKSYVVKASMGHVRDLPKSKLGVDIENNYEPQYITIRGKGSLLNELKKEAKKSDEIYLATDPDREGEAISWHLATALKIDEDKKCRIEFNEITKTSIKTAIKSPRTIEKNLVDAQQARRVLDRLVGYEISPILWRKVRWGLSAGRVQSVALKIICDREEEIQKFEPKEYWTIESILNKKGKRFKALLTNYKNKKINIENKEQSDNIIKELKKNDFLVDFIKKSTKRKNPPFPFTTSTLQQEAYKKINFSTKKTMSIAQQLYEGIEIKGKGTIGLITYMRTDSTRISEEAQNSAEQYIIDNFGKEYSSKENNLRNKKNKKNIQDAHEAIRPTYVQLSPKGIENCLTKDQYKLYKLIWERFLSSQMSACILNTISIEIKNGDYVFKANGSSVKFDGYTKVYDFSEEKEEEKNIPDLNENDILKLDKLCGIQHFTQPPSRFTEASLVKTLEENGIGRPSTYAPIISTIIDRKYIIREKRTLMPTELGNIVNGIMCEYFKEVVDVEFTAEMEKKLDSVEEGKEEWKSVIHEFFIPLKRSIDVAEKEISKITVEDKVTDIKCNKCGRFMVIKHGRYGEFLACPGYPECKNTKPIIKKLDVKCPNCGGDILIRRSKKGRQFYGCSNYPKCNFVSWLEPTNEKCPECGEFLVKKYTKKRGEYLQCSNKECKYTQEIKNKI